MFLRTEMKLKSPWTEFPKDMEIVLHTYSKFKKAVEEYRKMACEFSKEVREPTEPTEIISIEEFRNLISHLSPNRKLAYGNFSFKEEAHKSQCENLKIGDTVFFLKIEKMDIVDEMEAADDIPQINVEIVMAKVVE